MKASDKVAILAISEKLNSVMKMKIADLTEIDYLITELPAESAILAAYQNSKLNVL